MSTRPRMVPPTAPPGGPPVRLATPADVPRIVAAADAIFRNPPPSGLGSMGHDYPLLFAPENAGNLAVLEDEHGRLIAHAGFVMAQASLAGTQVKVATIGAVFTHPDHRHRGLASSVLAAAVARARGLGADLGLVSGQRGLYERAGFLPYPACPRYRVAAGPATTHDCEIVAATTASLPDLMRLGASEPVHFVRAEAHWRTLLAANVLFFEPAETFLVERAGRPVAYLAVGRPTLRTPEGDRRGARALELGGDRAAIAGVAPALARKLGVGTIDLVLPPGDRSMDALAQTSGWTADEVRLPFTSAWWSPGLADLPLPFYGFNYV